MMNQKKFIYTDSEKSAEILKNMGFQLVLHENGHWFFLNSSKLTFEKLEKTVYTDIMFT